MINITNLKKDNKKAGTKKLKKISTARFTIIAVILIVIFAISLTPITLQNDTFYTVKIGEHILNNGINMQDPFSWHEGLSYTYPHWLYDVITYLVYSIFNFQGVYITTCILASILGIAIYFVNSKISKNNIISFFITIGVLYLIKGYITARAQLATFILFILAIYFIEMFLKNKKKGYAFGLVLISLLIVNLHCAVWPFYFVIFLPYIGEYLVAELSEIIIFRKVKILILNLKTKFLIKKNASKEQIKEVKDKLNQIIEKNEKIKIKRNKELENPYKIRITKNKNVKALILVMIICVLMGFLTPLGTTPFTYLPDTMAGNTTKNINEHLPMTLADQTEVMCTLIIFLAILIFTKVKIKLSDLFMIGGLAYLMLASRRQLSMFAIIGSVILTKMIIELIESYTKNGIQNLKKIMIKPISLLIVIILVLSLSYNFFKEKENDKIISESTYPVQACDYILENIDLENARFYNEYNYGSYMLYRGIPVFIDSRCDLYAPEFSGLSDDIFMDFIETSNISKFYEDTFKKYDITHVITYKNSKMNMIIIKTQDINYKEIYSDSYFTIYERLSANESTD